VVARGLRRELAIALYDRLDDRLVLGEGVADAIAGAKLQAAIRAQALVQRERGMAGPGAPVFTIS